MESEGAATRRKTMEALLRFSRVIAGHATDATERGSIQNLLGRPAIVAAAILAAVEGRILRPGFNWRNSTRRAMRALGPPGRMPGSTAGGTPAATLNTFRRSPLGYSAWFNETDAVPG